MSDSEGVNEAGSPQKEKANPSAVLVTDVVEDGTVIEEDSSLLDDYPKDAEELDVTHMKITSLRALGLSRFPLVKAACFRQNLIGSLRGVEDLPKDLESLDLYDNRIERIDHHIEHFDENMTALDLSFNNIRHIRHLDRLTGLRDLYLCQNDISRIDNIDKLTNLTNLELGANRIREIKNLETLQALDSLWLAKNRISKLENLESLTTLRLLSIQSNKITKLEGLEKLVNLEELYISHNQIESLAGLENNKKLKMLDISNNKIKDLSGLAHLEKLEELWASGNLLEDFSDIEKELKHLPKLHTVYFEHNPLQRSSGAMYRKKVQLALGPTITQIDASPLPPRESSV